MGYLPGESDIFAWAEQQQISCCFLVGNQVTNVPEPGFYIGELSIGAKGYQFRSIKLTQNTTGKMWVSMYMAVSDEADEWVWTDWMPYAAATPPQEYSLPLVEGWTSQIPGTCRYAKSQENIVLVTFKAVHSTNTTASTDTLIAMLPEGFRPTALVHSMCIRSDFATSSVALFCTQDGGVWVHSQQEIPSGVGVAGEIIFVAAS